MDNFRGMSVTEQIKEYVLRCNNMDRRQKRTREAIFDAFGELISQKSFSKITVQEIIELADIGRSTFYAHFETKDDLLNEMCSDLFAHVFSISLSKEKEHDFSEEKENPHAIVTHVLCHLTDNKWNVIGILSSESATFFLDFFKYNLNHTFAPKLLKKDSPLCKNIPYDFLINHISSSFIGMIQWWIRNDLKLSEDVLAEYFLEINRDLILN